MASSVKGMLKQTCFDTCEHDPIKSIGSFSFCSDPIKHHVSLFGKCSGSNTRSVPNKHTVSCNWNTRVNLISRSYWVEEGCQLGLGQLKSVKYQSLKAKR